MITLLEKTPLNSKKGCDIIDFVRQLINMIPHHECENIYIIISLIDLYREIKQSQMHSKDLLTLKDLTDFLCDVIIVFIFSILRIINKSMSKKQPFKIKKILNSRNQLIHNIYNMIPPTKSFLLLLRGTFDSLTWKRESSSFFSTLFLMTLKMRLQSLEHIITINRLSLAINEDKCIFMIWPQVIKYISWWVIPMILLNSALTIPTNWLLPRDTTLLSSFRCSWVINSKQKNL